jgi:hypothetical protein
LLCGSAEIGIALAGVALGDGIREEAVLDHPVHDEERTGNSIHPADSGESVA